MKIAFLSLSYEKVSRGAETFIFEVSERLIKKGHKVEIISAKKDPAPRWPFFWRFYLDPFGIQVALFTLKNLAKIWREKYDIVIPTDGGWQPAFIRLVTWLSGGKVVISGQSGKGWDDRNNLWCFPNVFVALSSSLKSWARKVNPLVQSVKIPNGVDVLKFSPEGVKLRTNLPKPIILSVGALVINKRLDLAIKAVAKLGGASLLLIGKGPEEEKLRRLGEKLLPGRFEMMPFPYSKLPKVYRAADVFTYPTVPWESFGIVMVEAMASGLAVVATNDPIRKEVVGRAGVLVDPGDTTAYAVALENALRLKWGKRPVNQAKKFDWDKIAEKYNNLFESLLK